MGGGNRYATQRDVDAEKCLGPPREPLGAHRADGRAKVDWVPRDRHGSDGSPALACRTLKQCSPWARLRLHLKLGSSAIAAGQIRSQVKPVGG
jgi:hypothetical protein